VAGTVHVSPFPRNSVSRSGALLAPLAGAEFLTIAAIDLPSGYYQFDTHIGLQPNLGAGAGSITDTRNFRISITGFPDFTPQAVLNAISRTTGFINLNGSQSITLKVGDVNATANMIYSISVFLTKVSS
jgi:hypothetical protein